MKNVVMKVCRFLVLIPLLAAGCVTSDTWGIHPTGSLPVGNISPETVLQLKSAAASGETELVAAAARMAWADPEQAVSIANYAANLFPERSAEIAASVAKALER